MSAFDPKRTLNAPRIVVFGLSRVTCFLYRIGGGLGWVSEMRVLKGALPIVVSVSLILAATAILWGINSTAGGSHHLVYIYLFPVALIAALYNGSSCPIKHCHCDDLRRLFLAEALIRFRQRQSSRIWRSFCFRPFGRNCDQVHPTIGAASHTTTD